MINLDGVEQNKKQQLRQELEKVSQARKDLRTQARDMKTKMAFLTSGSKIDEQVPRMRTAALVPGASQAVGHCSGSSGFGPLCNAQIAALENRLAHSSMPLTEEKKTLEDIKKLKASRATCGAYEERIEKLASDDKLWNDIKEQMSACDGVLDSITKKQVCSCLGRCARPNTAKAETCGSRPVPGYKKTHHEPKRVVQCRPTRLLQHGSGALRRCACCRMLCAQR